MPFKFPADFLWGAATSAHQVEGFNIHNDWWAWEHAARLKETSGAACRHYELYSQDFDLALQLNHKAYRFSIEWSRIEPKKNFISYSEINHYKNVVKALRERGIEPVVTLHHFTNPLWFSQLGGWMNRYSSEYFCRYVEEIVSALREDVRFWITINEPMVYIYHAYLSGFWPPNEKSFGKAALVIRNLLKAHNQAYRIIHDIYTNNNSCGSPMVSVAKSMQAFMACKPTLKNRLAVYLRNKFFNYQFLEELAKRGTLDFIGINYYSRSLVDVLGRSWKDLALEICVDKKHCCLPKNFLGWEIYPQGLYDLLMGAKKYKLGVFILENGICCVDDALRWEYIHQHLISLSRAMENGVNVMGYLYWSLLDNYEWDKGFSPRFGLIEVDYSNFKRSIRESARKYAEVCKTGVLEI
jgi:beta-glucosidase